MRRRTKQRGFTLVELLVVIAIIGMLIGLLLPAVNSAREQGRRMTCSSQVRQLAQAVQQYEMNKRYYPGFSNWVPTIGAMTSTSGVMAPSSGMNSAPTTTTYGASFVIELLPFLERNDLYTAWRTPMGQQSSSGGGTQNLVTSASAQVTLPILLCPTNPPAISGGMPLAYVANTGCQDNTQATQTMPRDWRENGVFFNRCLDDPRNPNSGQGGGGGGGGMMTKAIVKMTSDFITGRDGMSNTLMFSENTDAGWYSDSAEQNVGFVWDYMCTVNMITPMSGGPPPNAYPRQGQFSKINENRGGISGQQQTPGGGGSSGGSPYLTARPASYHVGGVNATYCDTHTTFLNDQIDYYVYCLLMSPDGRNVKAPGSMQNLNMSGGKNFALPIDSAWLLE